MSEISESIVRADAFILVLGTQSVDSEIFSFEISSADENNNRLIPIVIDDINLVGMPSVVAALNWIFFRDGDIYDEFLQLKLEANGM
jgi:hypothetical protein